MLPVLLTGSTSALLPDKSISEGAVPLSQTKLSSPAVGLNVQAAWASCTARLSSERVKSWHFRLRVMGTVLKRFKVPSKRTISAEGRFE